MEPLQKQVTKTPTSCTSENTRNKMRIWTPILLAPLGAYATVEILIGVHADIDFLSTLKPYGLINAFESDAVRKTELAAHLASQIIILPLTFVTLVRALLASEKTPKLKNAAEGVLLTLLMSAFLFVPREGPRNAPDERKLFLTPLIERFNLVYALTEALFVFCLALGLAMWAAWLVTIVRAKGRRRKAVANPKES